MEKPSQWAATGAKQAAGLGAALAVAMLAAIAVELIGPAQTATALKAWTRDHLRGLLLVLGLGWIAILALVAFLLQKLGSQSTELESTRQRESDLRAELEALKKASCPSAWHSYVELDVLDVFWKKRPELLFRVQVFGKGREVLMTTVRGPYCREHPDLRGVEGPNHQLTCPRCENQVVYDNTNRKYTALAESLAFEAYKAKHPDAIDRR